jgi:hypothetical protein
MAVGCRHVPERHLQSKIKDLETAGYVVTKAA